MSFLDERDKPPRGTGGADQPPRPRGYPDAEPGSSPRRSRPARPPRRGRGTDRQTVVRRRATGIVVGFALVILAALLVRGCLEARQQRAFEDYVQEASSLVAESTQESEAFFDLLENPGDLTAVDVQNTLNGLSVDAERLVERAEASDPPDELAESQDLIVQVLDLRATGLDGISRDIPAALGDEQRDEAIEAIATEMQTLLASDVIYARQVTTGIEAEIEEEELTGEVEELPEGQFLPEIEWLEPGRVKEAIDEIPTSETDAGSEAEETAPQ